MAHKQAKIQRTTPIEIKISTSSLPAIQPSIKPVMFLGLLLLLISLFLLTIALGSVKIPLDEIVKILFGGEASKASWESIILKFRLPKALTAILAGASLAISGLMMQTFFRNPLAGPFILGISSGASLGVAVVVLSVGTVGSTILTGISLTGDLSLAVAASIGAGGVMALILMVARTVQSRMTLLIVGLMFSYLTGALVSLLLYFSIPEQIQSYINWTFGSFSSVTWSQLQILLPVVAVGLLIAYFLSKSLNAFLLGENYAQSMGLPIARIRFWIIASTALLAGVITAFCGPIGFIGIAVPHICRSLFKTSDHHILMPVTMIVGAIVALIASLIAEMPGSRLILPLNAVTAFLGAPIVIWVIIRQRNIGKTFE